MLATESIGNILKKYGFYFYSGVPCSFLKYLINYAINDCNFVMAANEGDAVAICAGAHLAGQKTVLLCQNSGLANALNPLTSLNPIFKIPILGFVSLRGEGGFNPPAESLGDQPQHEMMGQITTKMLDMIDVAWEFLSSDIEEAKQQLARANKHIENNKSFFFVVKKGTFGETLLKPQPQKQTTKIPAKIITQNPSVDKNDALPKRLEALEIINSCKNNNTVVLATTGVTGRELYEIEDAPNNLYMVGSMGCVSSIGLGITLAQEKKEMLSPMSVIAIDGDGALLMRLGALATNAAYTNKGTTFREGTTFHEGTTFREGMLHILLDNNAHDSTGGQETISQHVDFVTIAAAAGYKKSFFAHNLEEFKKHICDWLEHKALTFLHLKIDKGKKPGLGRPKITPEEVKVRLMNFLKTNGSSG